MYKILFFAFFQKIMPNANAPTMSTKTWNKYRWKANRKIVVANASANKAPTGNAYKKELNILSLFQKYKIVAAMAQGIAAIVNKMKSPVLNPPENIGINRPNIAFNP